MHRCLRAGLVAITLCTATLGSVASAQPNDANGAPPSGTARPPLTPTGQGIAVLAVGSNANEEAFAAARAIYAGRLRPSGLDEVRARVLAGGPPPANASRELRDLAEIRAGVGSDDAAGRRLLVGIAQQVGAEALLIVRVEDGPSTTAPTIGAPSPDADGGAPADPAANGNVAPGSPVVTRVVARLFLVESGDFDAARYSPDPPPPGPRSPQAWKSTVTSLEGRFPSGSRTPGPVAATAEKPGAVPSSTSGSSHFYTSAWFWGAIGGAALVGAAFYFVSRGDSSTDMVHLQAKLP